MICVSLINVIWVAGNLVAGNLVAGDKTKYTWVTPVKPEPVMVIRVPPAAGPLFGSILVTVGWGM